MHALYAEVTVPDGLRTDDVLEGISTRAVPAFQAAGAVDAYWMEPQDSRARTVVLFADEDAARAAAAGLHVGGRPGISPNGVVFSAIEVREVIAHL
jgi:hypothetical protein